MTKCTLFNTFLSVIWHQIEMVPRKPEHHNQHKRPLAYATRKHSRNKRWSRDFPRNAMFQGHPFLND
ncbi:hypothetical protein quinque_015898 [Culex quinquefasciatus]